MVVAVTVVIGADECDSMAIVDANETRDDEDASEEDANVDNEDDGTLWVVCGRNDVDDGDDDDDDDSADGEMQ